MDMMSVEADNTDFPEDGEKEEETHVSDGKSGKNCHGKDGNPSATSGGEVVERGSSMTRVMEKWELQLASKSPETRKCYKRHVRRLLAICGKRSPNALTDEDVTKYLNTLGSRASQDQALAAIKSFMKVCGRTIGDVPLVHRTPSKPIRELTDEQVRKMVEVAQDLREKVLILILRDTGGRITAICNLEVDDFRGDHLILRSELAKNKVESLAPITTETSKAIKEHLVSRGFHSLRQEGLSFVESGRSTLEEVLRVTHMEAQEKVRAEDRRPTASSVP